MKHLTFTIVLMLATLACSAQINNSFWGCTLGQSSRQDVREAIKRQGFNAGKETSSQIPIRKSAVKFLNNQWAYVDIDFADGKLHGISFMNALNSYDESLTAYEQISAWLQRQYGDYVSTRKSKANDCIKQCQYFDGKTFVWMTLTHSSQSPYYYVFLGYSDIESESKGR